MVLKVFFPKNNLSFRQAAAKAKRQAKAKAKASATSRAKAKAKPKAKAAAALPTCGTKRRLKVKTVSELVKKMKRQDGNHDNQEEERKELAPPDPDTTAVERSAVSAGRAVAVMAEEERPDSQGPGGVEVQATPPSPPNRPSSSASAANGSKAKSSSSSTSSSSSSSEDPAPAASSQVPVDSQVQGEENVEEPQPKRTKFQPSGCVKLHLGVLIIQVLS